MKYLIVGCGVISEKNDPTFFGPKEEIDKIKNKKRELRNFPEMNWAIRFSFDPETLVRIPYHEYLAEAKRRALDEDTKEKLLEKIKVTIDEPELEHCFKYVAMDIDDDEAIFILTKMRSKLIDAINDGIVDNDWLNEQINKLDDLLEFCWSNRTHFPGFRNLVRTLLDKQVNEKCILDNFVKKIKESEQDYCNKISDLINNPSSDSDYKIYSHILNELKGVLNQLNLSTDQFLILSMLNLSFRQFDKIKLGKASSNTLSIKNIALNPYLLFEEYEPDDDPQEILTGDYIDYPIELFKIDIALFPNIEYLESNYLQEKFHITDPKRIRALINQFLNSLENTTGDCFANANNIQNYLQNYPLFYKSNNAKLILPDFFLEKTEATYDAHLCEKLEIIHANDTKYYYLKKIYVAEQDIKDFILKLSNPKNPNILTYNNLNEYLEQSVIKLKESIGQNFEKDAFIQERKFLYENIFPNKFFIIAGNPGSGKSYEILNIIKHFISKGESYLLLTPTGKAALRLKFDEDFRDCKIEAMTIDKFINQWRNHPAKRKSYNNVIIDEMSMVDLLKFESVLRCFEPNDPKFHRLILVGDPFQLPPIGFGKPFYDIISFIKSDRNFEKLLVELDVNCRQELEGNEILNFSKYFTNEIDLTKEQIEKIENGGPISAGFNINYWSNENDLIKCLEAEWIKLANSFKYSGSSADKLNDLFEMKMNFKNANDIQFNMERFQVITPYRYFSDKINEYYQKEIRSSEEIDILSLFKNCDKIIRTKNLYRDDDLILSNGSIGLTLKWNNDKILCFSELQNHFISIYGEEGIREYDKEFFELAYSITVHKSQGSGFDHLIVVLPKRYGLLCKELFYTALTRSKKSISILIEGKPNQPFEDSLFDYARRRTYTANRKTTLMLDSPYRNYGLEPEKGTFVQSRVEHIIYRHLLDFKEKYHERFSFDFTYEQFPVVGDQKIRIKTDFTIYTRKGTYYWEHLGLLNKHNYKRQWLDYKLPTYKSINVLDRLITTDESRGINDDKIKSIIQDILDDNLNNEDIHCLFSNHHYYLR
jgi:ATP-dependent exoDNAse (exonuclease V) alpha subunit